MWISFKYERLPNFCFWCGCLNHSDKDCELWIESKGTLTPEQQQFNSSLKAALYASAGKDVIYVPGYYEKRKPKARASPQGLHAQPSSSEGRAENGGLVEEQTMEMVTEFIAVGIDDINVGEPLKSTNMEEGEALLSDWDTQPNPDSISSKSHPINAPKLEEVNK